MSRATSDVLDLLHSLVGTSLTAELTRAATRAALPVDDENYAPLNPQLIDKALKFLKDNGIDAPKANKPVDDLARTLGDLNLDDEAMRLSMN
jgi:tagatose-1,6-bisphosphate aldolase